MAAVVKFCNRNIYRRILNSCVLSRNISSSKRNHDDLCPKPAEKSQYQVVPDFSRPLENPNWVSYGYSYEDEKLDRLQAHVFMFLFVTCLVCFGGLYAVYMPDYGHKDWARREAFIRLHERETLGLEPVDPNYVDPSKMVLPSDEELGDFEIVI